MLNLNPYIKNDFHGFNSGAIILYIKDSLALQKIGQSIEEEFCGIPANSSSSDLDSVKVKGNEGDSVCCYNWLAFESCSTIYCHVISGKILNLDFFISKLLQ